MRCRLLLLLLAISAGRLDAGCGATSCPIDLHALNRPGVGTFTLDLSFQYIDQDEPRILTRRARLGELPSHHQELRTINRAAMLGVTYGVTTRLQISAVVPYITRTHDHVMTHSGEIEHWDLRGIGDLMLHARYRFGNNFWAIGGVKLPTGPSDLTNGQERAEVHVQPGSGSTDVIVGFAYEGGIIRSRPVQGELGHSALIPLFAGVTYRRNATAHHYTVGNEWQMNAGTAYPLRSSVELLLQANARLSGRDESLDPEDRELTGGQYLFLSPGIRISAGRAAWYTLIQLPVYQRVNGIQLTAQRNVISGVQMRF